MSKNLGQLLRERGIKPSIQRIRILEYVINHKTHPTVDMIYKDLIDEIPSLSKTTIYNTLNLFLEKSMVQLISIEDNETRYDADMDIHGHFKCINCKEIFDVKLEEPLKSSELNNFEINDTQIYFKGICPNCKSDQKLN